MKYANGIWSAIVRLWTRLFGRNLKAATAKPKVTKSYEPIEIGGRGHYFEGNVSYKASCRSSQSRRRKMERRTGRLA